MEDLKQQISEIKKNGVFTKEEKLRIKKHFAAPVHKERTENEQAIFEAEWNLRFGK